MTNEAVAFQVIQEAVYYGVEEFCLCPGARNSAFVYALERQENLKLYFWPEERSAAFFAMGRSKRTKRPVAIITTSGSAVAEVLPAVMEAYYSGIPLMVITADRPKRFRGTGAPQSAEQLGLFGPYVQFCQDVAIDGLSDLRAWSQDRPVHLNVCFEEPKAISISQQIVMDERREAYPLTFSSKYNPHSQDLTHFLLRSERPLIVVSSLKEEARGPVIDFLVKLQAPVFLEAISGIREEPKLQGLRLKTSENILKLCESCGYSVDGVLRIGGVPTNRLWRDLEELSGKVTVCSISETPFSGLSWGGVMHVPLDLFFSERTPEKVYDSKAAQKLFDLDYLFQAKMQALFEEEPEAEASLLHELSLRIPKGSHIYLGNSLPIREWDLAATFDSREYEMTASRGVNGIDGQISTFLGLCRTDVPNWLIIGDLTALYDFAGPWILNQLPDVQVNIVIVNNGGGKIFHRLFNHPLLENQHHLSFKALAEMWELDYVKSKAVPGKLEAHRNRLIELIPNNAATDRFWAKLNESTINSRTS